MSSPQTKDEILAGLQASARELLLCCSGISSEQFFRQPPEKWSVAQNIAHLITSAKMTRLAYRLPRFVLRLYTGTPNRPSRSYDELATKYKAKLSEGGKASGRFVAKPVEAAVGKTSLLLSFGEQMESLHQCIRTRWKDPQLDRYLAPHPLLGKITLRELGFFTIDHTYHHLTIIQERLKDQI